MIPFIPSSHQQHINLDRSHPFIKNIIPFQLRKRLHTIPTMYGSKRGGKIVIKYAATPSDSLLHFELLYT